MINRWSTKAWTKNDQTDYWPQKYDWYACMTCTHLPNKIGPGGKGLHKILIVEGVILVGEAVWWLGREG